MIGKGSDVILDIRGRDSNDEICAGRGGEASISGIVSTGNGNVNPLFHRGVAGGVD